METNIYWAVIRNQKKRFSYLEVTDLEDGRYSVIIDDKEYNFKSATDDFWDILHVALTKRSKTS